MRALGIVRQSKGRDDSLSPAEQRERIATHCQREGWELLSVSEEIDVSGGTPLARREGLRGAVEAVEAGEAEVVVVAYFDRLVRSLRVQDEVVSRIEEAGGRVMAVDFGEITGRTAAQWLSGTMIGAVSEYYRRSIRERAGEAQAMAVARGVVPFPNIPPGYERTQESRLIPDRFAPVVAEAFAMRLDAATIKDVRAFMLGQGVERGYHGVQSMLRSRLLLGEIHFGKLENLSAHEPIVEREVFAAVQAVKVRRGPRAKSDRLLARQGILRCGNCGARMVVGFRTAGPQRYDFYRCPPVGDCVQRVTIAADMVEEWIVGQAFARSDHLTGEASSTEESRRADERAERDQAALDAAIRALTGMENEPAAIARLRELRDARDASRGAAEHLRRLNSVSRLNLREAWPRMSLSQRRRALVEIVGAVHVATGRGVERLSPKFLV